MAPAFLYLACLLTASSSEVCEKEKCAVSSAAMIQAHQKISVTRLAQVRHSPTVNVRNVVNLVMYGQLADLHADLRGDGAGQNSSACGDGGEVAQYLLRSNESKVVALNANCYYHDKRYRRFFSVLEEAATSPPPFVLVFGGVNTPLTKTTQNRIKGLRGLKACYATNLLSPIDDKFFFPLPLGIGESLVEFSQDLIFYHNTDRMPIPWGEKKGKLLLPMMSSDCAASMQYVSVLNKSEFAHLVDFWPADKHVEPAEIFATYKAVLSQPGQGYDSFMHWECLAVGTVPLVTKDAAYDMRLFGGTGAAFIPPADQLTPDVLSQLLDSLEDPSPLSDVLDIQFWSKKWRSHLV